MQVGYYVMMLYGINIREVCVHKRIGLLEFMRTFSFLLSPISTILMVILLEVDLVRHR